MASTKVEEMAEKEEGVVYGGRYSYRIALG